MPPLGPIRLEPLFLPKVWAAPTLEGSLGPVLNPPPATGEIWLASDRHHVTMVAEGPLAGLGLDQVMAEHGEALAGSSHGGGFPLLLKILSVGQWLSVQVHPDDEWAQRLEGEPWGKSEAWHILQALPGAEIVLGLTPQTNRGQVESALKDRRLAEVLAKIPVREGDTFYIPAGTVHAIGPGMVLFEVQQASDVTYRFYDWDRPGSDGKPRELHQDQALQVMQAQGPGEPVTAASQGPDDRKISRLISGPHFTLDKCRFLGRQALGPAQGSARTLFVLQGEGSLLAPEAKGPDSPLRPGHTWVIPAGLSQIAINASPPGLVFLDSQAL
jgi:mannose-6-phosphate isomerase